MQQQTIIDCRIAGYGEDGVRIIAVYDTQNDNLSISKLLPYMPPADPYKGKTPAQVAELKRLQSHTVVVVDNAQIFPKWDLFYEEYANLDEAVAAYYLLERSHCLILNDEIRQQCSPEGVIEVRKMDLAGKKYELDSENVTNSNIAVLVACWAAVRFRNASVMVEETQAPTQDDIDSFDVPFSI